jgi:hypothetical protein
LIFTTSMRNFRASSITISGHLSSLVVLLPFVFNDCSPNLRDFTLGAHDVSHQARNNSSSLHRRVFVDCNRGSGNKLEESGNGRDLDDELHGAGNEVS